jgi:hypothetical protein
MIFQLDIILNLLLIGLIWTIQIVHYPLFKLIGEPETLTYHAKHMSLITPLVAPLMILELITQSSLLILDFSGIQAIRAFLLVLIWFSTFLIQVPLHEKIQKASGVERIKLIDQLVRTNWIRTLTWSIRGLMVLA